MTTPREKLIQAILGHLAEVEDYFDNRADADCDQDGFIPNTEMKMLQEVRDAIGMIEVLR